MAELWSPQPGARMSWGGHDLNYGLGWAVRPRKKNYGYCQVRIYNGWIIAPGLLPM